MQLKEGQVCLFKALLKVVSWQRRSRSWPPTNSGPFSAPLDSTKEPTHGPAGESQATSHRPRRRGRGRGAPSRRRSLQLADPAEVAVLDFPVVLPWNGGFFPSAHVEFMTARCLVPPAGYQRAPQPTNRLNQLF